MSNRFFRLSVAGAIFLSVPAISRGSVDSTGFEAGEGFPLASDVAKSPAWSKSDPGAGAVRGENAFAGQQSLQVISSSVDQAVRRNFAIPKDGIVFLDFAVLPAVEDEKTSVYTIDANGARLGFVKQPEGSEEGTVLVVSPTIDAKTKGNTTDTQYVFPLSDEGTSALNWIRITIRQDMTAKTWDLYLDGRLTLVNLPLGEKAAPGKGNLTFYASPTGKAFVDEVSVAGENPLFPDINKNGIPDAVEIANGLTPTVGGRIAKTDQEGIANRRKFLAGTPIGLANQKRRIIYVDSVAGDDSQTGEQSYRLTGVGPKNTLKAALREADDETLIALLPGKNTYLLPDDKGRGDRTRVINIVPIGEVSLATE